MPDYSLVIRNARIVDGTGRPSYLADVAVTGDRIAAIGRIGDTAAPVIDAGGNVLAPGFIEIHTHYDPQLCWDRTASPSLEHGFTTIVMGNCSLSLAPVRPGEDGRLSRLFNKVEDISLEFFENAVPYSWQSFPEYLDYLRPGLGVNVGALVGHTALRHFVMGDAAQQRVATDAEIGEMCRLLGEAIDAGAMGISLSYADTDENSNPVASMLSDFREKVALAKTLTAHGRRFLQTVRDFVDRKKQAENLEELAEVSLQSGAVCSALLVIQQPTVPNGWSEDLAHLEALQKRGARVVAQTTPRTFDKRFSLSKSFFLLFLLPAWADVMLRPAADRIACFRDPARRPQLVKELSTRPDILNGLFIEHVFSVENGRYKGRRVAEIAESEGRTPVDVIIDVALTDELETVFAILGVNNADTDIVSTIMHHPLIEVGASDSGAHVTQFAGAGDSSYMMEHFVRKLGKFTLERAVQRMTGDVAFDLGLTERGVIEVGRFADLVIFDPDTIARGNEVLIDDLPGGGGRYVRYPTGIHKVIVNGEITVDEGRYTGVRAGRIV